MTRPFRASPVVAMAVVCGGALFHLGSEPVKAAASAPYAYDVKVSFSPEAVERMKSLHRGVSVDGTLYGDPTPEARVRLKLKPTSQLGIGSASIPVDVADQMVHVTIAALPNLTVADLVDQKPNVLIQVSSGDAAPGNTANQLHCELFDDLLSLAQKQPVALHCEVIPEDLVGKE